MLNIRFRDRTNAWPGFVDLFSNLVIILIFLLIVFVFLWTTTSVFNKNTGVKTIAELKQANQDQAARISQMTADEARAQELLIAARDELNALAQEKVTLTTQYEEKIADLNSKLAIAAQDQASIQELQTQRENLQNQLDAQRAELSEQLAALQAALDAAEEKSAQQQVQYVEMSTRLNRALADKVAELNNMSQYQSEFYKAIKMALGDRTTIQPDGDRFIVSSDILFPSGSYSLSDAGKKQLRLLAGVINDLENKIPSDINWIIRVDGHTDSKGVVPGTCGYKNNVELSLLRATAVANELAQAGVSRRRLVPSGFGEMHPVVLGNDAASLQQNRRIELQLTNR